jgi:glycosyltransferase involved in cell wall biosynthesis
MMVGFDARAAFLDPHRGFGRVTASLAAALLRAAPGTVVVFVPHGARVPPEWYPLAARIVQLRRPRRAAFLADPLAWRWTLGRRRVEVLHLPAWGVPPGLSGPVVATFHDATPFRFPSPPSRWQRLRARLGIRSLRRATLVHACSHHAAGELATYAGVPAARVRVVYWGVGAPFRPSPSPLPPRHLLFVGGDEPHKNLALVVEALTGVAAPPLLAVVPAGANSRVASLLQPLTSAGRAAVAVAVGDDEMVALYQQAVATLVPSRNEGFGLPALEAMACGSPVLAANCGALPEVCGNAALLLDPDDPAPWREAIAALGQDASRRAALAEAGLARAATFTWERCAAALLEVYREAIRLASS